MKKIMAIMLVMCALVYGETPILATEVNDAKGQYLEEHYQVNFDDTDVYIVDGCELIIEPEDEIAIWDRQDVSDNVTMLENSMEKNVDLKETLVAEIQSGEELMAVSVTEAPVVYVDNHAERITTYDVVDDYAQYEFASSVEDMSKKGEFYLYTIVSKADTPNANGTYDYFAQTKGGWFANSFWGGSDYPADGEDVIIQTAPNTWVRKSHTMEASYDNGVDGIEKKEYWFADGDEEYLECHIYDDPSGWRQNTDFALVCTYAGNSSNNYRMVKSYYVHTWVQMSVDVSTTVSAKDGITVDIDPGNTAKSWTLFNGVTFDF